MVEALPAGADSVSSLRTHDTPALLGALKALKPPFDDAQRGELIALAVAHADAKVRTAATKHYDANFDDMATLKSAFRTIRTRNCVADSILHELGHEHSRAIACALMFHARIGTGTAFDLDADVRRVVLGWCTAFAARHELTELWLHDSTEPYETPHFHTMSSQTLADVFAAAREAGLRGIRFKRVAFDTLPASLADAAPWMKALQIASSTFTQLPPAILSLENLEELVLWSHALNDLPDLASLKHLKLLDISWSRTMTSVPASVCHHPGIEHLKVGAGEIAHFPESITNMRSLRILDLERSPVVSLPAHLTTLPSLETIVVSGCARLNYPDAVAMFSRAGRSITWKA